MTPTDKNLGVEKPDWGPWLFLETQRTVFVPLGARSVLVRCQAEGHLTCGTQVDHMQDKGLCWSLSAPLETHFSTGTLFPWPVSFPHSPVECALDSERYQCPVHMRSGVELATRGAPCHGHVHTPRILGLE